MMDVNPRHLVDPGPHAAEVTSRTFFGALHAAAPHPPHSHDEDQLYWFPDGVVNVLVGPRHWVLRGSAAFWFPAGTVHAVQPVGAGTTHSVYSSPRLRPPGDEWAHPRAVSCPPLMAEILRHITAGTVTESGRAACRTLLSDLLSVSHEHDAALALPTHAAARSVAERILEDPRDDTPLSEHARRLAVSERTIMRAFVAESGCGFLRWRAHARLVASLSLLALGTPVNVVADAVGYRTASGYIDAFRREYGVTPAAHARTDRRSRPVRDP